VVQEKEDILLPCPALCLCPPAILADGYLPPALQEAHAYFFCVEDRALLCRACDVAVHTANAFVSAHRRFLLTGVQVGLQPDAEASDPRAQGGRSRALQRPAGRRPAAGGWVDGNEVDSSVPSWSLEDKRSAGRAFQLGTGTVSQVSSGADG